MLLGLLFARVIRAVASPRNEIVLNRDLFRTTSNQLAAEVNALRSLRVSINNSFAQLRQDWNSAAGRAFFAKFENELLNHIDQYANKLNTRAAALNNVTNRYEEVFRAADNVANARY